MANIRYFAEVAGQTVRFDRVDYRSRTEQYGWHADSKSWVRIQRTVEYKLNPSKHACNGACINASGKIMRCECSCGGKNHGKGRFDCSNN